MLALFHQCLCCYLPVSFDSRRYNETLHLTELTDLTVHFPTKFALYKNLTSSIMQYKSHWQQLKL